MLGKVTFCQCSLAYVTFDLHRQRLEQMFSDVLVPLSELVRLGRIQEHPGEDDDLRGQRRWWVLLGEAFSLSSADSDPFSSCYFCVMRRKTERQSTVNSSWENMHTHTCGSCELGIV